MLFFSSDSFQNYRFQSQRKLHVCFIIRTNANLAKILTVYFVLRSFLVMFHYQSVHHTMFLSDEGLKPWEPAERKSVKVAYQGQAVKGWEVITDIA